jgi:hypothetical protein
MAAPYILKMEYIDWFDMCQMFFKKFCRGNNELESVWHH